MSETFAELNGVRIHYRLDGPEDGEPLALVNMGSSNLQSWTPVMDDLARTFRVLRHDIRGTGRSGGGPAEGYTFPQYADDLAALMDHLSIPRAFVMGLAYGARTAGQFALRHPGRLTRIAFFDVAFTPPVEREAREAKGREAAALLAEAGERMVESQKAWFWHDVKENAAAVHTAHLTEPDITERLATLAVPCLVACGRQDLNLAQAERVANTIPGAAFHVIERCGHGSILFQPKVVSRLLLEFAGHRAA
ncbi:MAG: alpha/beta fold hydrolase [Alphaproteobacteria bacterium]|nr:alpha/beta fold hydrolase [Alphaproteobacteria bacterium]